MGTQLKKEFTDLDFKIVETAIVRHFKNKKIEIKEGVLQIGTIKAAKAYFGLPYTSSSSCAGLWITNTEVWFDLKKKWSYTGFAITEDGKPVAIIWDNSSPEQEILLAI